jgi:L-2,4-diaminobutyrate decarboxylase
MKISGTQPRYERILTQKMRQVFPLASRRGRAALWKMLEQLRPALEAIDPNRSTLPEFPTAELRLGTKPCGDPQQVIDRVLSLFGGLPNWAHPLTQMNLMPPTTAVSVVTAFLTALFNPDMCSTEFSGKRLAEAESRVVTLLSELVGYDPHRSFGFFTYGGTAAIQYGIMLGLEKASPGRYLNGQQEAVKIICSNAAHFSVRSAAGMLGLGSRNVVQVETNSADEMNLTDLARKGSEVLAGGAKIGCVVATLGTTDTFGLDNLAGVARIRDRWQRQFKLDYPILIHADAAIGWAWNFFRDYDFAANPLQFPAATLEAVKQVVKKLADLPLADTISLNPHKYGYAPIPAAFLLFRENGGSLAPLRRQAEDMPQLYYVNGRHPGAYTLETTRYAGGAISTLANMMLLGREGYQAILGRTVEMGLYLREQLAQLKFFKVVNADTNGGATIFYYTRPGLTVREENGLNRVIMGLLRTGNPDLPINLSSTFTKDGRIVLKSLIMTPFVGPREIDRLVIAIRRAARAAAG